MLLRIFVLFSLVSCKNITNHSSEKYKPTPYKTDLTGVTFKKEGAFYDGIIQWDCRFYNRAGLLLLDIKNSPCRLVPQIGKILFSNQTSVGLTDINSNNLWEKPQSGHHDFVLNKDKNLSLSVIRKQFLKKSQVSYHDGVSVYDLKGSLVFSWNTHDNISQLETLVNEISKTYYIDDKNRAIGIKINSATFIENHPYKSDFPMFKDGNVILSLNRLSLLIIVDIETGKIVWNHKFSNQHGYGVHSVRQKENGNILFFENHALFNGLPFIDKAMPQIVEFDLVTKRRIWTYPHNKENTFFSPEGCTVFELPNGNFMISYESNFSVVEITPEGEIVWEWFPKISQTISSSNDVYGLTTISKKEFEEFLKNSKH